MTRRSGSGTAPDPAALARWGLAPAWSITCDVPGAPPDDAHRPAGTTDRWHLLVRPTSGPPLATVVCVHGNPTWAVLWAPLLHDLDPRIAVVAPDQLGMGYSDRTSPRRYSERVDDLDRLIDELGRRGVVDRDAPLVLVGHDWGGAIAMGWAVAHPDRVAGLVLTNTGIAVPAGRTAPPLIRVAASRAVRDLATRRTSVFVRGASRLPGDRPGADPRSALLAPYLRSADRRAVSDFVGDVPFSADHPSAAAIDDVASRLPGLDVPALLLWGGRDPVFDDHFAADLAERLPRAELHRIGGAGHLVPLADGVPTIVDRWIGDVVGETPNVPARTGGTAAGPPGHDAPWSRLDARRHDTAVAFHDGASGRSVSFQELCTLVETAATRLLRRGVAPGDRVGVLVPPSVELVALVYACWRIGAVTVIADRGLGLGGLGRALRSARADHLVGPRRALLVARTLRWGANADSIDVGDLMAGPDTSAATSASDSVLPAATPDHSAPAAVLFTSGATGPAKGVRYTLAQLVAQRDALERCYGIGPDDRFVAAFAPFALYGPALGIASAIPDVDVTSPGDLTAAALDRACAAIDATMVFASPAALANVVATATGDLPAVDRVRTVMSAGAPVPIRTLRAVAGLATSARLHTPYGMTETLPVADIDLAALEAIRVDEGGHVGRGVCVGLPVSGCDVMIAELGFDPGRPVSAVPGSVTGEVLVRAPWTSSGYDRLWHTERTARPRDVDGATWHRSGDVGHLDADGRLWIEGRSVHVVETVDGPVTPVPVEVAVETLDEVARAAAVGVGPTGVQQVVIVIETEHAGRHAIELADLATSERIRAAVAEALPDVDIAAVCRTRSLPVDIRHNAKIDRTALGHLAARLLAGERV